MPPDDGLWESAPNSSPATTPKTARWDENPDSVRAALETAYRVHRGSGMTASEAAEYAGYSETDYAWKQVAGLVADGLVKATGASRPGPYGRKQRVYRWVGDAGEQDALW